MIAETNQRIKMFSVWYWNKRGFCKWITVYAASQESAIAEVEAREDFYKLDSIKEQ